MDKKLTTIQVSQKFKDFLKDQKKKYRCSSYEEFLKTNLPYIKINNENNGIPGEAKKE